MAVDPRWRENQAVVQAAAKSANDLIPALEAIIETGAWREFVHPMHGIQRFDSFTAYCREFVELEPQAVESLLDATDRKVAASTVRKMLREEVPPAAGHGDIGKGRTANRVDNIKSKGGTDPSYIIARLKRDYPDIAAAVVEGTISARAAAIKAGFRKPYIQVRADDPGRAVAVLLKHYSAEQLRDALGDA